MAKGMAGLLGIKLPENFRLPYRATSPVIFGADGTSHYRGGKTTCTFQWVETGVSVIQPRVRGAGLGRCHLAS